MGHEEDKIAKILNSMKSGWKYETYSVNKTDPLNVKKNQETINCSDESSLKYCRNCKYCSAEKLLRNAFYCDYHETYYDLKIKPCEKYREDTPKNLQIKTEKTLSFPLRKLSITLEACWECPYHDNINHMCDKYFLKVDGLEFLGFPEFCELEDATPINLIKKAKF